MGDLGADLGDRNNKGVTGPNNDQPPKWNPQLPSQPTDPTFRSVLAIEDDTIVAVGRPGGNFSFTGLLQFGPRQSGQGSSWVYVDQFVDLLLPTDVAVNCGFSILTTAMRLIRSLGCSQLELTQLSSGSVQEMIVRFKIFRDPGHSVLPPTTNAETIREV
jgi:hypothetical protein